MGERGEGLGVEEGVDPSVSVGGQGSHRPCFLVPRSSFPPPVVTVVTASAVGVELRVTTSRLLCLARRDSCLILDAGLLLWFWVGRHRRRSLLGYLVQHLKSCIAFSLQSKIFGRL